MYERHESDAERYDRNWSEILQELRVAQTGVQILAGFLLTLPFSSRFEEVGAGWRGLYLVAFGLAVMATGLIIAPVAFHRFLFGRHEKDVLVRLGNTAAKAGTAALALTLVVVVTLIFGVVLGPVPGVVGGALMAVFFVLVWVVVPVRLIRRAEAEQDTT